MTKPLGDKAHSNLMRQICRNRSGATIMEFCVALPVVVMLLLGGVEAINYAVTNIRVGQMTSQLADNAGRLGSYSGLGAPQITEADVNEVIDLVQVQSGSLDLKKNGQVILSSLQVNEDGGQWIAWQRCSGKFQKPSSYGKQGQGKTGTSFPGMGPAGQEEKASPNDAVMFVETHYKYQPIFDFALSKLFTPELRYRASYPVREFRDLRGLYNPGNEAPIKNCWFSNATDGGSSSGDQDDD